MNLSPAEIKELNSLLKHLEWDWKVVGTPCHVCHSSHKYGHEKDCALKLALDKFSPLE